MWKSYFGIVTLESYKLQIKMKKNHHGSRYLKWGGLSSYTEKQAHCGLGWKEKHIRRVAPVDGTNDRVGHLRRCAMCEGLHKSGLFTFFSICFQFSETLFKNKGPLLARLKKNLVLLEILLCNAQNDLADESLCKNGILNKQLIFWQNENYFKILFKASRLFFKRSSF